ncbi:MAG: bifunctional glutamate N-acetyltransferase/amino-acid acetyltransferase ArgJ [Deltaproteobacteria bacterium]|nr:bifunctional glutamate N-acetyltransferase/amino-acid acetyltransferase ArgJ [Deltaproteobacteria bacterium]
MFKVETIPDNLRVRGFRAVGVASGIKKGANLGKKDLALIVSDIPARAAGVFTRNKVKAAPVQIDIERIMKGVSRGVIVNSGNANACTGRRGYNDALRMTALAEKSLGFKRGELLVSSTGVIGVPMPMDKMRARVPELASGLSYKGLPDAALAMMTTDAFPKTAIQKARIGGVTVTIVGIAKGAGMICPDMATMLAYFMTDANIKGRALKAALKGAADSSFNSIIVDNDMSTNDTALIFANGLSGGGVIREGSPDFNAFSRLLNKVSLKLAHMIVKDGEGATRFIEIDVRGAGDRQQARTAARTVASSFLVKTAFFGGDPNWGRIMAALGYSGVKMKEAKVSISFNGVEVVKAGVDTGKEKAAARGIKTRDVAVKIDLGAGTGSSRVWTTDLSYDYVRINSAYRT